MYQLRKATDILNIFHYQNFHLLVKIYKTAYCSLWFPAKKKMKKNNQMFGTILKQSLFLLVKLLGLDIFG